MKRAHYFYQFFCQKSNTGYDGMGRGYYLFLHSPQTFYMSHLAFSSLDTAAAVHLPTLMILKSLA